MMARYLKLVAEILDKVPIDSVFYRKSQTIKTIFQQYATTILAGIEKHGKVK